MSPSDLGQTSSADRTRKRPRPVISCLRCREKKLKCDRVTPCQNCVKAECPSTCAFQNGVGSASKRVRSEVDELGTLASVANPPMSGIRSENEIIEDLERRLRKVEGLLAIRPEAPAPAPATTTTTGEGSAHRQEVDRVGPSGSARPYLGTLAVKGTRTRYHGQHHRVTLLHQSGEAKAFLKKNCHSDSPVFRLFKEIQFIQRKSNIPGNSPESVSEPESSPELQELKRLLPPRHVCDLLVDLYLANFERTFRILHVPTFRRQYAEFCNDVNLDESQSLALLPQVTAVLVIGLSLVDRDFKNRNAEPCKYLQKPAIHLLRAWLQKATRKQRTDPSTLQTEVLVTLARQLRAEQPEELWQATGAMVRMAMVMGLHLDLSTCTNLSAFQRELRRRLWVTVVEMELQASIAAGMPSSIPDIDFGPVPPTNIDDTDFDESTADLPAGKPWGIMTDASTQMVLANSLPIRLKTASLAQRNSLDPDSTAATLSLQLQACLYQVPMILKLGPSTMPSDEPAALLNRILLDLFVRRSLFQLQRLALQQTDEPTVSQRNASFETAIWILDYQDRLDPKRSHLTSSTLTPCWNLLHVFCRNDFLQTALNVCEFMKVAPLPWPSPHTEEDLPQDMEHALDGLTRNFDQPGSNMKDVLLLSVALQHVRARGSDEAKTQKVQQGVIKAFTACRQQLLSALSENSLAQHPTLHQTYPNPEIAHPPDFSGIQPPMLPIENGAYVPGFLPQVPDFLGDSSLLANEFSDFLNGPFDMEDGAFNEFFANF
ncbi:hypothetical protein BJX70DRAFT_11508 [Aspergillus crustosus]